MQTSVKSILTLSFAFTLSQLFGQSDSSKTRTRNVIWFTPTKADKINGIAIGPFQSGIMDDRAQTINGLSITLIGVGLLFPLAPQDPLREYFLPEISDSALVESKALILNNGKLNPRNGLSVSLSGDFIEKVNGVNLSGFCGQVSVVNGVSAMTFWNLSEVVRGVSIGTLNESVFVHGLQIGIFNRSAELVGVQIGIFNKSLKMKGIQIGLWNKNRYRTLPIINWGE